MACQFVNKGVNQQNATFYGMSLFYYLADFFMFIEDKGSADGTFYNQQEFHSSLQKFAMLDWE